VFVRLDWKSLSGTKHSNLLQKSVIYGQKSLITMAPDRKILKEKYSNFCRYAKIFESFSQIPPRANDLFVNC
jgi:hypothetical protein